MILLLHTGHYADAPYALHSSNVMGTLPVMGTHGKVTMTHFSGIQLCHGRVASFHCCI
jgi:hypothetical protein